MRRVFDQAPAANQEQESPDQPEQKRKKCGAPKGHRGATRKPPDRAPDRTVLVNPCQCPECHSGNISACHETEEHTQEDLVIIRPLITGVFNHETLMSLVETAKLRGINPLDLMLILAGGDDPDKIKTMLFVPNTS